MKQNIAALVCGFLFGLGLAVSQMIDANKVLAFLDIAGAWDPSLLLVMGGALLVAWVSFRWILRQPTPLLAERFSLPTRKDLEPRLIIGAAIFGVGWGLGGYCPGPGIAALTLGFWEPVVLLIALVIGAHAYHAVNKLVTRKSEEKALSLKS